MAGQDDSNSPQWQSGPIDWEDVSAIERALEAWTNGARLDFEVTEDMFCRLLGCAGADDGWFEFSAGQARWKDQPAQDHDERQQRAKINAAANLDFPITLSATARWYVFAQAFIPCSLPSWVPKVLAAASWDEARAALREARRAAEATLREKVAALLATPDKPAEPYLVAKGARDQARRQERAVVAFLDAARRAEEADLREDLLAAMEQRGLSNTAIDYADFLALTTFDSSEEFPQTGPDGFYAYRKNSEGEVVGITSGPAVQQFGAGADRRLAAEHQRDASFHLPCSVRQVVEWVLGQGGDVQLTLPGSDELPETASEWVDAVAVIAKRQAMRAVSGTEGLVCSIEKSKIQTKGTRKDEMALELEALEIDDQTPIEVMDTLQKMAGMSGSCITEKTDNGVKWKAIDGTIKSMDLEKLRKRLARRKFADKTLRR